MMNVQFADRMNNVKQQRIKFELLAKHKINKRCPPMSVSKVL